MSQTAVAFHPQICGVRTYRLGTLLIYELFNAQSKAQIIPSLGAMLQGFEVQAKGKSTAFVKGYASGKEAQQEHLRQYRGAKLSPSPNRTLQGRYRFWGNAYQMPLNFEYGPHQIHGFVAGEQFDVLEAGSDKRGAYLSLQYCYGGNADGFPFPYRLHVTYVLDAQGGLSCHTVATNLGNTMLPLGDGWHPYFQLEGKVNDWLLSFPAKSVLHTDALMIPTGHASAYYEFARPKPIGHTHFDTCFLLEDAPRAQTLLASADGRVRLQIWQEGGEGKYKYLQIFTPGERDCIAIEPMTCPPNALNSKTDLLVLQPKESVSLSWGMHATCA
jgi:aldose 1-epimerase